MRGADDVRTPWPAVTIMAAYAAPGRVLAVMMSPVFDHGDRLVGPGPPASEVTQAVMLPWPASG